MKVGHDVYDDSFEATYCPEDNKLRLYVDRVPREEYLALCKEGWKSTPKQDCDFVATWAPGREDTALAYAGYIGDEDQGPADRAADRAERFAGYLGKRTAEARGFADTFDAGPAVHGHQNEDRAAREAKRHDRDRLRAVCQWGKAEYWQRRTAGVIGNALHKSSFRVRCGRILRLESEQRKHQAQLDTLNNRQKWAVGLFSRAEELRDSDVAGAEMLFKVLVDHSTGQYRHPRNPQRVEYLSWMIDGEDDPITMKEAASIYMGSFREGGRGQDGDNDWRWQQHFALRLSYEKQMRDAEGGTVAEVEIEPGGWFGKYQVQRVNRSPITKLVVSVHVLAPDRWFRGDGEAPLTLQRLNVQKLGRDTYRAPTSEELVKFAEGQKVRKAEAKTKNASKPKLINPTLKAAQRLQDALNAAALARWDNSETKYMCNKPEPSEVKEMTQAEYSSASKGSYSPPAEASFIRQGPVVCSNKFAGCNNDLSARDIVFKVRTHTRGDASFSTSRRVVVLTDKPQKPLPSWKYTKAAQAKAAQAVKS